MLPSGILTAGVRSSRVAADGLEAVDRCPVCGGERRELLYEGLTDRNFGTAPGRWTLHRCLGCRLGIPRSTSDPRDDRHSRTAATTTRTRRPLPSRRAGPRAAMLNGYLNARWGYELAPASLSGASPALSFPGRRAYADRLVRHLPSPADGGAPPRHRKRRRLVRRLDAQAGLGRRGAGARPGGRRASPGGRDSGHRPRHWRKRRSSRARSTP